MNLSKKTEKELYKAKEIIEEYPEDIYSNQEAIQFICRFDKIGEQNSISGLYLASSKRKGKKILPKR